MNNREVMQQALEALENCRIEYDYHGNPIDEENAALIKAADALRAALAEQSDPKLRYDGQRRKGMSDRELLELAAKAAGLSVKLLPEKPGTRAMFWQTHVGEWNPLTEDGDAFRLAVRLHLLDLDEMLFRFADDPLIDTGCAMEASVRRAIVRAAAEIGRSKE